MTAERPKASATALSRNLEVPPVGLAPPVVLQTVGEAARYICQDYFVGRDQLLWKVAASALSQTHYAGNIAFATDAMAELLRSEGLLLN